MQLFIANMSLGRLVQQYSRYFSNEIMQVQFLSTRVFISNTYKQRRAEISKKSSKS